MSAAETLRKAAAKAEDAQYVPNANVPFARALSSLLFNEANAIDGAAERDQYYNDARRDLLERLATAYLASP